MLCLMKCRSGIDHFFSFLPSEYYIVMHCKISFSENHVICLWLSTLPLFCRPLVFQSVILYSFIKDVKLCSISYNISIDTLWNGSTTGTLLVFKSLISEPTSPNLSSPFTPSLVPWHFISKVLILDNSNWVNLLQHFRNTWKDDYLWEYHTDTWSRPQPSMPLVISVPSAFFPNDRCIN